jgi:predicted nucleotidyltransferase
MSQRDGGLPENALDKIVSRLREDPVRLALLFGSHATGDTTERSDVDIAVAYDQEVSDVTGTHLSLVVDLTRILGRDDLDIVRLTAVDPRIAVDALETGQLLLGTADDAAKLCHRLDNAREKREDTVQARISEAERAIERRIDRREND